MERFGGHWWLVLLVAAALVSATVTYTLSGGLGGGTPGVAAPAAIEPLPPLSPSASPRPGPTATPTPPSSVTARALATPTATATTAPARAYVVVNTAGLGLALRQSPADGGRIRAWAEGTLLVEAGPEVVSEGRTWKNLRDPAGNVGWMAAEFLAPASVASEARPTLAPTGTRSPGPPPALPTATPLPSPTPVPTRATYDLELIACRGYRQDGYAVVEGRVRNVGARELRFVWAMVDWYDADRQLVKSHSVPIKQDPLPAGQASPFKVMAVDNAHISYFVISFREIRGGSLTVLDSTSP